MGHEVGSYLGQDEIGSPSPFFSFFFLFSIGQVYLDRIPLSRARPCHVRTPT